MVVDSSREESTGIVDDFPPHLTDNSDGWWRSAGERDQIGENMAEAAEVPQRMMDRLQEVHSLKLLCCSWAVKFQSLELFRCLIPASRGRHATLAHPTRCAPELYAATLVTRRPLCGQLWRVPLGLGSDRAHRRAAQRKKAMHMGHRLASDM